MRIRTRTITKQSEAGFALVLVMVFAGISLCALVGALTWTSTSAQQTSRNIKYFHTAAAAEAASEKALASLLHDYQSGAAASVQANMAAYRANTPSTNENPYWGDFLFSNGEGGSGNYVERIKDESYVTLDSQYKGLKGWSTTYRIISNARQKSGLNPVKAAVGQDIETASIPIFQFAIFYGLDLELHSMTEMEIMGRVHCNKNIYTYPSEKTTFWEDVTAVGSFYKTRKPGDPAYSTKPPSGSTVYKKKKDAKVASLTLPIGTNNTASAVRQVLLPPPPGEPITSGMGRERFYNKADLVIMVTNNAVSAFAKAPYSETTYPIAWTNLSALVSTDVSFTDQREGKLMKVTQIDVGKIQSWSTTNASVGLAIGAGKPVNLIYVADQRSLPSSQLAAVRLVNGQTLPSRGLTVATPNPLYVKGHYNQPTSAHLGTKTTTNTKPAALASDSLTALSGNWSDAQSNGDYDDRNAANMTLNAAVLTGIVETSSGIYSGGAHNLARFLEDWSGKTFTYNGSMVVLFNSISANQPFQQPGSYYEPPQRDYSFDLNFTDPAKLPPGTPELRGIIRDRWAQIQPGKTHFPDGLK